MSKTIILHESRISIDVDDWETEAFVYDDIFLQFGQRVLDPGLVQQASEQDRTEYYQLEILKNVKNNKWLVQGNHFTPGGVSLYPKHCGAKAVKDNVRAKVWEVGRCLNLPDEVILRCLQKLDEEL